MIMLRVMKDGHKLVECDIRYLLSLTMIAGRTFAATLPFDVEVILSNGERETSTIANAEDEDIIDI